MAVAEMVADIQMKQNVNKVSVRVKRSKGQRSKVKGQRSKGQTVKGSKGQTVNSSKVKQSKG